MRLSFGGSWLLFALFLSFFSPSIFADEVSSCANLTTAGMLYNLTADIPLWNGGTCFNITEENITLDLQNHYINGTNATDTYGFYTNKLNSTVKNGRIENFSTGIYFNGADSGIIQNATAFTSRNWDGASNGNGFYLANGSNMMVSGSSGTSASGKGIHAMSANYLQIINSTASSSSSCALVLATSNSNNITGGLITTSAGQSAINITDSNNSIFRNITINGSTACINISSSSENNSFFYNELYNCTIYIDNKNSNSTFNTTVNGIARGNFYDNISNVSIFDSDGDNYGDYGAAYPYSAASAAGSWLGFGSDWGPIGANLTTLSACTNITESGMIYGLTADIPSWAGQACFNITAENVTLNMLGHYVNGSNTTGTYGFYTNKLNSTVKNGRIENFSTEIWVDSLSNHSTALNMSVSTTAALSGANGYGFYLLGSNATIINGTSYAEQSYAISIGADASGTRITNTNATAGAAGGRAMHVLGPSTEIMNSTALSLGGDPAIAIGSSLAIIRGNNITSLGSDHALRIQGAAYARIENNYITSYAQTEPALRLFGNTTLFNNVTNNTIFSNTSDAVELDRTANNTLVNNTMRSVYGFGFYSRVASGTFYNSHNVVRGGSIISDNTTAISFADSHYTTIRNATISSPTTCISLPSNNSNNSFFYNYFYNCSTYINNSAGSSANNTFNTTVAGIGQGNYYDNILNVSILDLDQDNYGDYGSGYPYSSSTTGAKWAGNGSDWGPIGATITTVLGCANLTVANNNYTLETNVSGWGGKTCINITAENVTIEMGGNAIAGTNGSATYGIYSNKRNSVIKNGRVENFSTGIYFNGVNAGRIENIVAYTTSSQVASTGIGLYILTSNRINITNVTAISVSGFGIYLPETANSTINGSVGNSSENTAIYLGNTADDNRIENSNASSASQIGFRSDGTKNLVVSGLRGIGGGDFNGIAIRSGAKNATFSDSVASADMASGLYVHETVNSSFIRINATSTAYSGAFVYSSNNTLITNSSLFSSTGTGLSIWNSTGTNITGGSASSPSGMGVRINISNSSIIRNVTISAQGACINVSATSENNTFFYNYIYNCSVYVDNANSNSTFNTTSSSVAQGNFYDNILNASILDLDGNNYGETGADYPYSSSTTGGKWLGLGSDWGPIGPSTTFSSCANLSSAGVTYNLTSGINGWIGSICLNVTNENITIDLRGHSLNGSNLSRSFGIYSRQFNTTVKNGRVENFSTGIYYFTANNGTILNVSTYSQTYEDYLGNGNGLYIQDSHYFRIENTSALSASNGTAIYIRASSNGSINRSSGISPSGIGIYFGNTADNDRLENSNGTSNSGTSGIRSDVTAGLSIRNSRGSGGAGFYGIFLNGAANASISGSTASGDNYGIFAYATANAILADSNVTSSAQRAVLIWDANYTRVINSTLVSSSESGLAIVSSKGTNVSGGIISTSSGQSAVKINESSNSSIIRNVTISAQGVCINVSATSENNSFFHNYLYNCSVYVDNANSNSTFNTTSGSVAQGNFYDNILNASILDLDGNNYGETGADYPYSSSTTGGKWLGLGSDWGPIGASTTLSSCTYLSSAGVTYNLTSDIASWGGITCFNVTSENITLDGRGRTITGTNVSGVYGAYSNKRNTTVKNLIILNFSSGIWYDSSGNGTMLNNTINASSSAGISLTSYADNNTIENNTVWAYGNGIHVLSSANNTLARNWANSSAGNGTLLSGAPDSNLTNNTGIGGPEGRHGIAITGSSSNGRFIRNSGISAGSGAGILYSGSSGGHLEGNSGQSLQSNGIWLSSSSYAVLFNDTGTSESGDGLNVASSTGNNLTNSTFSSNSGRGAYLEDAGAPANTYRGAKAYSNSSTALYHAGAGTPISVIGSSLESNSGYGMVIDGSNSQFTISNSSIGSNLSHAFYINGSYNTIGNLTVFSNSSLSPILLKYASHNNFSNITVLSNRSAPITANQSNNTRVRLSNLTSPSSYGALLLSSWNFTLAGNLISSGLDSLRINGSGLTQNSSFGRIENNTLNSTVVLTEFTYDNTGCGNTFAGITDSGSGNTVSQNPCGISINQINMSRSVVALMGTNFSVNFSVTSYWDQIDNNSVYCNFTLSSTVTASAIPITTCNNCYRCSYQINTTGEYNLTVGANNTAGQFASSSLLIRTYSFPIIRIYTNQTSFTLNSSVQNNITLNITIESIWDTEALGLVGFLQAPAGWETQAYNFSNFSNGTTRSAILNVSVPLNANAGIHYIYAKANWTNPVVFLGSTGTNTSTNITEVEILGLSQMALQEAFTVQVSQNSSATAVFYLNSTGNQNISGINLMCRGDYCQTFNISFNESLFNLVAGGLKRINASISAIAGQASGFYPVILLANASSASDSTVMIVQVVADYNWTVSTPSINTSGAAGTSSPASVTISNNGNQELSFNFNISGNATEAFSLGSSTATVAALSNFTLNLTMSPSSAGNYYGHLRLNETSAAAIYELALEFRAFSGSMNISPNATVKIENVSSGDTLKINATVYLGGAFVTNNLQFWVSVNQSSCPITAYVHMGSGLWHINCTAPDENQGHWHNLTITANYTPLNLIIVNTTYHSIHYSDLTPPALLGSRINVSGTSAYIQANVSDGVNVTNVTVYISQLASNVTMNRTSGNTYEYNLTSLSVGDYDVIFWFNDTSGNSNSSTSYFEVWEDAGFSGNITNSTVLPVAADFRLYRPNSTTTLHNFSTNASGAYSATIHARAYDANIHSSLLSSNITLKSIYLPSYSDSIDLDGVSKLEANLQGGLNGFGARSNITGNATIYITYLPAELTMPEDFLKIYRCANWNFTTKTCNGSWTGLASTVDKPLDRVYAFTSNFSDSDSEVSYVLGEREPSGSPDVSISAPDAITIQHNRTGTGSFGITATGTGAAVSVHALCSSGTICLMAATSLSPSSFDSIPESGSETVYFNVSIPYAYPPGTYYGTITAYGDGISNKTSQIEVIVPSNATWELNQTYYNSSVGTGESEIGRVVVRNLGNVNITLSSSTNDSFAILNQSSFIIIANSSARTLKVLSNATSPGVNRTISINISNSSAVPSYSLINVSLHVVNFTVAVSSPTNESPVSGIISGTTINITANATLDGSVLSSGVNWTIDVAGTACTSPSYSYSSGSWLISCTAPNIETLNNSMAVKASYSNYSASQAQANSVAYRDTSPPTIVITAPNTYRGETVQISILPSDNAGVSSVSANITHPNGSVYNLSLSYSAPYYQNTFATSGVEYGTFNITAAANDTSGLNATNYSTFNVLRGGFIAGNFTGANGTSHTVQVAILDSAGNTLYSFNASGVFNQSVNATDSVTLRLSAFGNTIELKQVNISNNISDIFKVDSLSPFYVGGGALSAMTLTNISTNYTNGTITMDYSGTNYASESNVGIYKCSTWDFATRFCTSGWERLSGTSADRLNHKITANISSFSAYAVAEYICGDGVCNSAYGEGSAVCQADCAVTTQTVSVTTGGGGGGGGGSSTTVNGASEAQLQAIREEIESLQEMAPGSEEYQKQFALLEELYKNLSDQIYGAANLSSQGLQTITNSIYFELYPGEEITTSTSIRNTLPEESEVRIRVTGNVKPYVSPESESITLGPNSEKELTLFITLPYDTKPGVYYGSVEFENVAAGGTTQVPFNLRVLQEKDRLLDLKIQPVDSQVEPGGKLRIETNIYNLGEARRVDAQLKIQLIEQETEKIASQFEESLAIETSLSSLKAMDVPPDTVEGKYVLRATATYPVSTGLSREAISIATVEVRRSLTPLFLFLFVLLLMGGGYALLKRREREKKRFLVKIDFAKLPQFDERAAFLGKIAETNVRAAFPVDRLVTHALLAGASGSGKTVAAQALVEEVLKKKVAVIVFDPTAQWTGFLRKNSTKEMLDFYPAFGMNKSEATAFPGNIYLVKDPNQKLNIKELMLPGEISVFTLSGFKSTDIETLVYNTIEEIFSLGLEESKELKLLVVFDEVHRLLPKFGGTGKGFTNIERAVREFRKWGVGMLLSSQVLSDFVGEIKTNISTEIQLRTKYEEDLNRIKMKYGDDILKYIVKSPVGTGMIQNAEFNRGNPYFVSFRPLLHSIVRLSDSALEKYQAYNERIGKIINAIALLRAAEVDVFDVELELKLARDKLNKGSFEVVEIYLESLEKKLEEMKKKGK